MDPKETVTEPNTTTPEPEEIEIITPDTEPTGTEIDTTEEED